MDDITFASLLCSRLCHDMISPVGALANGVEILAEEQDAEMQAQVVELLGMSARQTTVRLKFFRMAFGAAGGLGAELDLGDAHEAISTLLAEAKIETTWNAPAAVWSKDIVKLLLNLALIAGESLIRGGQLTIDAVQNETGYNISISARGERLILQDAMQDLLLGQAEEDQIQAREMPAYLAHRLAASGGAKIEIPDMSNRAMTLKVVWPQ